MDKEELSESLFEYLKQDLSFGKKLRGDKFNLEATINTVFLANKSMPSTVLSRLLSKISESPKSLKYLEVGSGLGISLVEGLREGFNIKGLEPGKNCGFEGRFNFTLKLLSHFGINPNEIIFDGFAENMSMFVDEEFDVVYSNQVLEHVKNVQQVLKESQRVLRKGGMIFMSVPHYNYYYEGHYQLFWLPYIFLNKKIAKQYLALRGKDKSFVDELNFITYGNLYNTAKQIFKKKHFYIMPHFKNKYISFFSVLYYYQQLNFENIPNKVALNIFVQNRLGKTLSKPLISFFVRVFIMLGFAESLNLIYYKK
ncbi:class I SAM-dependent methyltransferase [Candidatus Marinarcus aquaticus]|uniref:Class I SAM-dependent methyltransferase n=1 Tax=Candidatus Marinarcus aquaticus TaxID=2044504 RepID=A0A4V1LNS0_9BACT|nr:class I SAM-dependent methyltransferase [Candidatus Marinarcus aquaticus]RXJ55387.1 hypothetical protein CRV04_09790 [Candidatus Marinarcus aquaticus]